MEIALSSFHCMLSYELSHTAFRVAETIYACSRLARFDRGHGGGTAASKKENTAFASKKLAWLVELPKMLTRLVKLKKKHRTKRDINWEKRAFYRSIPLPTHVDTEKIGCPVSEWSFVRHVT
jgi:hypothetical protein